MQIGKAFTYVFEDTKWFTKLLLGALVSIVPILNFAFIGYLTEILRRVPNNDQEPLPSWDDFGKKFMDGLLLALAGLVYSIPLLLLGIPFFPMMVGAMSGDPDVVNTMATITSGLFAIFGCLAGLYGLFLTVFYPAVQINFSRQGSFGSCFQIGTIIKVATGKFGNYLLAWLMYLVFAVVIGTICGICSAAVGWIPCIGWIAALLIYGLMSPLIGVVYAHLFGQVGAKMPA